jgi:predicted lipid-binding transport protein (Tim44 family)
MYAVLSEELRSRGAQQTDVVTLNADLLEVATEGERHWASVRFSGLVSEAPGAAPASFEEVWNLSKPVDGSSGWQLAGIQQMH